MADHAYTVLKSAAAGKEDPKLFEHGLDYAQFGDNIGLWNVQHWLDLHTACHEGKDALTAKASELLPVYEDRWRALGCPMNAEEWQENDHRIWKLMQSVEGES